MYSNANTFAIDPKRIAVGGLEAAVALMARDQHGPPIAFQFMEFPVTDDRMETASVRAFTDTPNWTYDATVNIWRFYLGESDGGFPRMLRRHAGLWRCPVCPPERRALLMVSAVGRRVTLVHPFLSCC